MDNQNDNKELELTLNQDNISNDQKNTFQQNLQNLQQELKNSKYQTFNSTNYWNQKTTSTNELKSEAFTKEMIDCLKRIETKLTQILFILED